MTRTIAAVRWIGLASLLCAAQFGCGGESLEDTPSAGYVAPPAPGGEMKPAARSKRVPSKGVPLGFQPAVDATKVRSA